MVIPLLKHHIIRCAASGDFLHTTSGRGDDGENQRAPRPIFGRGRSLRITTESGAVPWLREETLRKRFYPAATGETLPGYASRPALRISMAFASSS
ncbi:MAG TPA: hypothetical protein P5201_11730, partial [Aminobacteriaceae bacterium]|nr:hypothetical protein [Aminobacteriaceae bacterium]